MKIQTLSLLLFILCLTSCFEEIPEIEQVSPPKNLIEILNIMEANSINKKIIDWSDFRTKVLDKANGAQRTIDTYPAIREALSLLGDNHSSYIKAEGGLIFAGELRCDVEDLTTPSIPDNIGYVKINSFSGTSNSLEAISFAKEIQSQITAQNNETTIGWIVDLRNNGGGNMWPMIAGCGSLLGEGIAGYFVDPDDNKTSWGFENGASVINGNPVTPLNDEIELIIPEPKIAVILNNGIASSGEVMAISFIGRENTKSFGIATCGLSTSNQSFNLSDNSRLNLTTAFLADRNNNLFGIPVPPDELVGNEDAILKAIEWIEN